MHVVIKIGLLLDSRQVPVWQQHIVSFIRNNPSFTLQLVVLNDAHGARASHNVVYRIVRKIDRAIFRARHDCFVRVNVSEVLKGVEVVRTTPIRSTFTDGIPEEDLAIIRGKGVDLFIRFGFRILKGDILNVARFGVWSLHHGDSAVSRGGPPAFWEVINKEPVTGVTLQVLSSDLDGGAVIKKAFVKTDRTSFNRNQNALYWASIELFCSSLQELAVKETVSSENQLRFYSKPLYRNPGNAKAFFIFFGFWARRLQEVLHTMINKQQWSLYYQIRQGQYETSLFRYKKITPPAGADWADPFVIYKDKTYFVFFEEFIRANKKAHISIIEFDQGGKLKSQKPVQVLTEPHHLSYPFVFENAGTYYMIPESAGSLSVWIYKCERFPDQWKKHIELLAGIALYDPTLHLHNKTWYLFGTEKPFEGNSPDQYLHVYFSDDLFSGSWKAHPQNPLTRDVRGARPAGRIFEHDGKLLRPAQIGAPKYGYGIRFQEIVKLTPEEYEERPFDDILPDWKEGLLATHTFNFVDGFSVVDGQM